MRSEISDVELANGVAMPSFGFGTWPIPDREAESMVVAALEAGTG